MDIFIGVVVGLLVLMILVTLHELGHFIAARRNGVNVLEFGIGFPPRMKAWVRDEKTKKWKKLAKKDWKKPQNGLIFSLNWLPIGGFCQMDGESAADTRAGTFGKAKFWAKTKILFAGVAMNWLAAFVIFTILAWTGMPQFLEDQFTIKEDTVTDFTPVQITNVAANSPAYYAGIQPGDYIIAVDGNEMIYASDITDYNSERAGGEVVYTIEHEGQRFDTLVTLNPIGSEYLVGVSMATTQSMSYSTWSAPLVGAGITLQLTGETFKGVGIMIWDLITGVGSQFSFDPAVRESGQEAIQQVGDSVSGPVGIIGVLFPAFTSAGPANLAFLAALISVSLACMNVLPIPALDGGRWLIIAIYKIRRKKLEKETEEKIVARAFIVLLALIAIVTILDIVRLAN